VTVVWQTVALVGIVWLLGALVLGMLFGLFIPRDDEGEVGEDCCPVCLADWKQPHEAGCPRRRREVRS
jgi:hypothetical protein